MRGSGNYKTEVKEKYPNATCVKFYGEQFARYGVILEKGGKAVTFGTSANQAWRRAWERHVLALSGG